ncbi:hypothetical protein M9H77_02036 [Catharanthus roseus]|uniref:Uncharacterized protein n=1 Tax=Catharanthus roseus TaxID=4058 RepID=A0ACC0C785_CATRO|nr:hypothetical protein M9H77_02036 [Catharanthus roseus]
MQGQNTVKEVLYLSAQWGYTVFYRNAEDNNVLSDIIVAHPTSIAIIRTWPYVLIMDTTYKTNKYWNITRLEILFITDMKLSIYMVYEDEQKEHVHRDHIMRVWDVMVAVKIHIYHMASECVAAAMGEEDEI